MHGGRQTLPVRYLTAQEGAWPMDKIYKPQSLYTHECVDKAKGWFYVSYEILKKAHDPTKVKNPF